MHWEGDNSRQSSGAGERCWDTVRQHIQECGAFRLEKEGEGAVMNDSEVSDSKIRIYISSIYRGGKNQAREGMTSVRRIHYEMTV